MKAPKKRMSLTEKHEVDAYMRRLAHHVSAVLPPGPSRAGKAFFFVILADDPREGGGHDTNYISNANREDAIKLLRETADRLERNAKT